MTLILWLYKKSFSFNHFLESKFVGQLGQTQIDIVILFIFMFGHHKLVVFMGINDIDALVLQKKSFFSTIFRIKASLSIQTNTDSHNNLFPFHDWAS